MRYLAIDHGQRRTGLAICDPSEAVVSPLAVVTNGKDLAGRIAAIVESHQVEAIVVGLPLNMDGSEGFQAKQVAEFTRWLRPHFAVPIYFQDERLSSFAADQMLQATDLSRAKKRRRQDALAAAAILEAFLERKRAGEGPGAGSGRPTGPGAENF